ncbi:MAG: LPS-assembly protein LptD, partial [Phaeodactylibacter sp.]|nr:LPS-assembly protein LptD [Phaeodactylibacter sp.]
MKAKLLLTIFGLVLQLCSLSAQPQRDSLSRDTLLVTVLDTSLVQLDSLPLDTSLIALDSLPAADSTVLATVPTSRVQQIKISKDSLDAEIDYSAQDSMIYDLKNQKIYLYGNAEVNYTSINLKADFIEFDWTTNTVTARGRQDASGALVGRPQFADGDQQFTAKEMRYNFKTRKGVILHASTIQNNLYVIGERAKFISADPADTTQNDIIYNSDAIFTTCDHPEPHFGIHSNKQKVVPNKLVIVGPSNVEIMGVPTPLWLPFGFFPISTGKSTGLLFPRDFEYSDNWGFGLRNVGWYFPLGDQMDLQLTSDIYLKGTFRLRAVSSYARRYKYRGNVRLEYHSLRNENSNVEYVRDQAWIINMTHNQDAKAHPSRNIGGNINIQTDNAQSRSYNDANSVLNSTLGSNFSYRES